MRNSLKTLRIYYHYVAKKKLLFVCFVITVILTAIAESTIPFFYKLFTDAIPSKNFSELFYLLLLYIGIQIFRIITNVVSRLLGDYSVMHSSMDARIQVFKKIQDLDFAFHASKSTGGLISAMKRGDGAYFSLFDEIHFHIINTIISFTVTAYFLGTLHPTIVVILCLSIISSVAVGWFVVKNNVQKRRAFTEEEDTVSGVIVDNMVNFETVKYYANEIREEIRLKKAFVPWQKAIWAYMVSFRFFGISLGMIHLASIFGIFYIGIRLLISETISLGDFIAIVGFVTALFPKFNDLIWSIRGIAKNFADIERYFSYLSLREKVKDPNSPIELKKPQGEIEFKDVTFSYGNKSQRALNSISLTIRQGQSVALVGTSGAGKTTITKLLMRFYDVNSGSIHIDGLNIKKMSKRSLRSLIGVVPQEPILFNNTVEYNIAYGANNPSQKAIESAAKLANLHDLIETLPEKYKTNVGERGIKLSGGQKQRLAIARMILSNPLIVVFDEATSQLDSENEALIQDAFWKATKDKTTIIIAHRLSTAKRADKIYVMEKGKIIESGSHDYLVSQKQSRYNHFWTLQTKV